MIFKSLRKTSTLLVYESRAIRKWIEKIASLKERALLSSFGFQVDSESDLSESKSEREVQTTDENKETSDNNLSLVLPLQCSLVRRETISNQDVCIKNTDDTKMHDEQLMSDRKAHEQQKTTDGLLQDPHQLFSILKLFSFNWFEFLVSLKSKFIHVTETHT